MARSDDDRLQIRLGLAAALVIADAMYQGIPESDGGCDKKIDRALTLANRMIERAEAMEQRETEGRASGKK